MPQPPEQLTAGRLDLLAADIDLGPGTMTRTTETGRVGCDSGTAMIWPMPTALSRPAMWRIVSWIVIGRIGRMGKGFSAASLLRDRRPGAFRRCGQIRLVDLRRKSSRLPAIAVNRLWAASVMARRAARTRIRMAAATTAHLGPAGIDAVRDAGNDDGKKSRDAPISVVMSISSRRIPAWRMRSTKTSITASPKASGSMRFCWKLFRRFELGQRPVHRVRRVHRARATRLGRRVARGRTVARLFEARRACSPRWSRPTSHHGTKVVLPGKKIEAGAPGDPSNRRSPRARSAPRCRDRSSRPVRPSWSRGWKTSDWLAQFPATRVSIASMAAEVIAASLSMPLLLEDRQRVAVRPLWRRQPECSARQGRSAVRRG